MKQIVLIAVFVCTLQVIQGYTYHKDPTFKFIDNIEGKVCTSAGKTCKNCDELIDCIQIGDGKFIEVDVKQCDTGKKEFCNSALKDCSTAPNPGCAESGANDFTCHSTGVFPDPLDCRVYHMCIEPQHKLIQEVDDVTDGTTPSTTTLDPTTTPTTTTTEESGSEEDKISHTALKCDDNLGYNPITTYCETELSNNECPISSTKGEIPIICEQMGESHAIKDTSMFYVCTAENGSLVPQLFMCPAGGRFNEKNNVCERKVYPSTTSEGTTMTYAWDDTTSSM